MDSFMLSQCSTVGKCFPTEATTVRPFARMYTHMNLLRTTRPKRFAALFAWKLSARDICVRMAMIHQRATVRKFVTAHIANDRLVTMRLHVSLEPCLIVKRFATLRARMVLFARMFPRMFHQRPRIAALFAAQTTRILRQFGVVLVGNVSLYRRLLQECFATKHAPRRRNVFF